MDKFKSLTKVKKRKRVTRKPISCPNPLFEKWLMELKDEASKKDPSSNLVFVYSRALKSLQKYPLKFHSGKECKVLKNFGPGLCAILDKKLEQHISNGGTLDDLAVLPRSSEPALPAQSKTKNASTEKNVRSREKEYIPGRRTGAYAILLALHKNKSKDYLTKIELQEAAQPFCDTSLTKAAPNSRYSAWSCMSQLIDKGLVDKSGCPAKFQLTETGRNLAARLEQTESELNPESYVAARVHTTVRTIAQTCPIIDVNDVEMEWQHQEPVASSSQWNAPNTVAIDAEPEESPASCCYHNTVVLRPGEYEIFLCVDTAEVSGGTGTNNQKEGAAKAFQNCGVPYQIRKLAVGDYVWICKPKANSSISADVELVLPFVVERKRLDDLASSIKDGRFKEQKFRLKNCGLSRPIYLVEEFGSRQNLGLPEANLMQAVANTVVIEGFQCHWTQKSSDSIAFLAQMTKHCVKLYEGKTVSSRAFDDKSTDPDSLTRLLTLKEFNAASLKQKPLSVTNMFAKQLMQLNGLSVEKAEAIVKVYPTPTSLMAAFRSAGTEASQLLSKIECGKNSKRTIGPTISQTLAKLYTQHYFDF